MANLKEVRDRIKSVQNTQQITKAMKMVSAAKLRRAQDAITQMRPYANKLNEMLVNILTNLEGDAVSAFGEEREVKSACVVVVTSNRGLCGAFNSNIIKEAVHLIETELAEVYANGKLSVMCIGKRGFEFFSRHYSKAFLVKDFVGIFEDLSYDNISRASTQVMDGFSNGTYDKVYVNYGRFKNAGVQFPETAQFLPVVKIEPEEGVSTARADYIFEPTKEGLLDNLIPSILRTTFQKFLLDTHASEHGARMTAMDKATENAEEMLRDLKISYNKARQEAITNEILEIVSGAAALEGA